MRLADEGDLDAADAAGREFAKNIDPRALKYAAAVRRRGHVHVAALVALTLAIGTAALSLVGARRRVAGALPAVRRLAPVFAVFLVHAGLVGGYLASTYENSSSLPFVLFAAFLLPLLVVVRVWSAVGSTRPVARVGRAAAAVAATIALGFLVVERLNPAYLEGFGL